MKAMIVTALSAASVLSLGMGPRGRNPITYEITFKNITHGIILTPPIFSLSEHQISVYRAGEPASLGLEMLAEGGATDELRTELEAEGLQDVVQMMMPLMPGASVTVELEGNRRSRLNLASMLLPKNDGFVAANGPRVYDRSGIKVFMLRARDAGTENNDERCASIPGPQCGGEGFNEEAGEGFVVPHPGTHGEGDLSR